MTPKPADDKYNALCIRLADLQREAGAFLGQTLSREDPKRADSARRIAEDFAREANEVADEMKEWRLANGYDG